MYSSFSSKNLLLVEQRELYLILLKRMLLQKEPKGILFSDVTPRVGIHAKRDGNTENSG